MSASAPGSRASRPRRSSASTWRRAPRSRDLFERLGAAEPQLAPALRSVLPVVAGEHVTRDQPLADRQEVALLPTGAQGGREWRSRTRRRRAAPCSSTRSPTARSGPTSSMAGPVADGGHIVWNSTPGCWGPMITPAIRGGHEVCTPVAVEGAEVGDAIAIRIKDIAVTSIGDLVRQRPGDGGPLQRRPVLRADLPGCGAEWPETRLEGIGETAVRCASCGADATPFTFTNGYTVAFDDQRRLGLTVHGERAEELARDAAAAAALPGQLDPEPDPDLRAARHRRARHADAAVPRPARHVAVAPRSPTPTTPGDFGAFLVGAPHAFAMDAALAGAAQDRRPPRHRRRPRGRDPRLPGEAAGRGCVLRRHARDAGRRRDRRPHRGRRRHASRCRSRSSRASGSTARCCSRSSRTCRSWPSR